MNSPTIPRHIAIIMDGNGRWAKEHGFSREEGHRRGAATIENIVESAKDIGVRYLTLYAFSEENWHRPKEEVASLMQLLKIYLSVQRQHMIEEGIRFMVIGDIDQLSPDLQQEISKTVTATKELTGMTLIVALSYGSRQEICRAVNSLIAEGVKEVNPAQLTEALDTTGLPDPDLLIRTSGESRISNFLLWQMAYTEFYFTEILWPDFNKESLREAIREYQRRERRFGLTSEQL
jgi:undecaprenyl diphosphate synthase